MTTVFMHDRKSDFFHFSFQPLNVICMYILIIFNNFSFPLNRWVVAGSTSVPRQGGQIAVLGGKPTVLGGFYDYDKYPALVEQFDVQTGFWFPLKNKLRRGRRYFGLALVPETLFPQCI